MRNHLVLRCPDARGIRAPAPRARAWRVRGFLDKPSIAVLPFANMSDDPQQEYFSDGITEDLITDLSKVSGLLVIARNSTFTYKGKSVRVRDVGRELGVRYVLEGSVRRAGSRVRISAQLIEAGSDHHLWAERYDREMEDIFAVQDEVTEQIVSALRVQLSDEERERVRQVPTRSLESYDCAMRAEAFTLTLEPGTREQARELFERAIDLDPGFAQPHSGLAMWWMLEAMNAELRGASSGADLFERAIECGRRAVRVADSSRAHSVLGLVLGMARRYDEGQEEAERALALNPSDARAYLTIGAIHNHRGRAEEAMEALEQCRRLDPVGSHIVQFHLGIAHQKLRNFDAAIAAYRAALAIAPFFYICHFHLAVLYLERGEREAARREVEVGLERSPDFSIQGFLRMVPADDPVTLEGFTAAFRELGVPES